MFDSDRFLKILRLTTSDNDNEALQAVRTANLMLISNDLVWDDVVGSSNKRDFDDLYDDDFYPDPPPPPEPRRDKVSGAHVLQTLKMTCTMVDEEGEDHSAFTFVHSVSDFYKRRKYLTQKQWDVLQRIYQDLRRE